MVTPDDVAYIAKLANIPVSDEEKQQFAQAFAETLTVIEELRELDNDGILPTHQVTGLKNVWREDVIDKEKMFYIRSRGVGDLAGGLCDRLRCRGSPWIPRCEQCNAWE